VPIDPQSGLDNNPIATPSDSLEATPGPATTP